jgi:2'-5' RNA ligase
VTDRLFFALLPSASAVASIAELATRLRTELHLTGRAIDAARWHVTLIHLGDFAVLPFDVIDVASHVAAALSLPPVEIVLDRAGSFQRARGRAPFVLLADEGEAGLVRLHQALGAALMNAGLACEPKRPFAPHLTLMYADHPVEMQPIAPIRWTAHELVLMHSLIGQGRHVALGRWPLQSGQPWPR